MDIAPFSPKKHDKRIEPLVKERTRWCIMDKERHTIKIKDLLILERMKSLSRRKKDLGWRGLNHYDNSIVSSLGFEK